MDNNTQEPKQQQQPTTSRVQQRLNDLLRLDYPPPAPIGEEGRDIAVLEEVAKEKDDFEYAREAIRHNIDRGKEALDELVEISSDIQKADYYKAVASIIEQTTGAAEKLMNIRKLRTEAAGLSEKDKKRTETNIEQAIIFQGSTADLLRQIKNTGVKAGSTPPTALISPPTGLNDNTDDDNET